MDDLSCINNSVVYLELYAEDPLESEAIKYISRATGFIWEQDGSLFLITNWHVFTGRNHDTGSKLGSLTPRHIKIKFTNSKMEITKRLYDEDDNKCWMESRKTKIYLKDTPDVDIAILPLDAIDKELKVPPLNVSLQHECVRYDICLEVTTPISVVGFPLELGRKEEVQPIWVAAYVALPPQSSNPLFLANGYPYSGMSGSPVFWVFPNRPIKLTSGGKMVNNGTGTFLQFVGVYSGRMLEDSETNKAAPLARIWNVNHISDILKST